MDKGLLKRKVIFLLGIVVSGILLFTNVYAEEALINTLPKEYTMGDFTYTIDGFEIRVYDASNDNQGNSKYFNKKVLHTIPITDNTLTINPQELISSMNGVNGTFINLNLSIDKEKFESLVKSKVSSMNNGDSYICELIVNYKLLKIPASYSFMHHINTIDLIVSMFSGGNNGIEQVNLNTSTYQVINLASLSKENGVVKFIFDEEESKTEANTTESAAILDYVYFSQNGDFEITNDLDSKQSYIFMLHNLDNIEELLQSYSKIYDDASNQIEVSEENKNQTVKVSDTAFNFSKVLLIIGCFIIILGIIIVMVSIKRKNQE